MSRLPGKRSFRGYGALVRNMFCEKVLRWQLKEESANLFPNMGVRWSIGKRNQLEREEFSRLKALRNANSS
jgi:hypothetical protein